MHPSSTARGATANRWSAEMPQLGAPLCALRRRLAIPVDPDPYRTLPPPPHIAEEVDRRVTKDAQSGVLRFLDNVLRQQLCEGVIVPTNVHDN